MNRIRVRVKLFSTLERHVKDYELETGISITLPEGATVGDLIQSLGFPPREARLVSIHHFMRGNAYVLTHGDEVSLFGSLGGG